MAEGVEIREGFSDTDTCPGFPHLHLSQYSGCIIRKFPWASKLSFLTIYSNIDRLASIWQALHDNPEDKDTWVTPQEALDGTWVTGKKGEEGPDTKLAPFYKDETNFWTSADVRSTHTFGYAYPETQRWNFKNTDEYRLDIGERLEKLYPASSIASIAMADKAGKKDGEAILRQRALRLSQITDVKKPDTALTALSLAKAISPPAPEELTGFSLAEALEPITIPDIQIPDDRAIAKLIKNDKYLEWLFNIKAQKHTLQGQYSAHVFLGRVPEDEPTVLYPVSPHHVGTFSPLGQPSETKCGKCQDDQNALTEVTGQIPLTIALAERYFAGLLPSLKEEDVISFLQEHLHWEVVDKDGRRLEKMRDAVDGLLVGVVSNEVTLPEREYELPIYSPNIKIYPEITTKEKSTEDEESQGRAEGTGITEENMFFVPPTAA